MPKNAELDAAYAAYYGAAGAKFHAPFELAMRLATAGAARRLAQRLPPGAPTVFDVGCGRGLFLAALLAEGVEVWGFERSREATFGCDPRIHLHVGARVDDVTAPSGGFGAISIRHVLEHLKDPVDALRQMRTLLHPDGWLLVDVPAFDSLQAAFGGSAWFHLDPPRHLFHFTEVGLRSALVRCGYDVVESHRFSLAQDPMGWLQTTLHKLGRPRDAFFDLLRRGKDRRPGAWFDAALATPMIPLALAASVVEAALGRGGSLTLWGRPASAGPRVPG